MNIFYNKNTDPAYNLALEEYLFKNTTDNWFFVWQNDNAVIIGKNQVALKEIDSRLAAENKTKVVRRMTGGGAVYHDMGNVNFSFIMNTSDNQISFERYTEAIVSYLNTLGVGAEFGGRNDILVDGKKISGNAQHIFSGRVLHHGTLLFDANLEYAGEVLTPDSVKMQSKGVASVKSRITNIRDHLELDMTTDGFIEGLLEYVTTSTAGAQTEPTEEQTQGAQELRQSRYSTWDWNFAASPRYDIFETRRFPFGGVTATLNIKNGFIEDIAITGDFFGTKDVAELYEKLKNTPHDEGSVRTQCDDIGEYINGMNSDDLIEMIF